MDHRGSGGAAHRPGRRDRHSVTWTRQDSEWVGLVREHPEIEARVNEYGWSVTVAGALARQQSLNRTLLARAMRRREVEVLPLDLGRELAERFVDELVAAAARERADEQDGDG